jgi:hypothetical protein
MSSMMVSSGSFLFIAGMTNPLILNFIGMGILVFISLILISEENNE